MDDDIESSRLIVPHDKDECVSTDCHDHSTSRDVSKLEHKLLWYRRIVALLVAVYLLSTAVAFAKFIRPAPVLVLSQDLVPEISKHAVTFEVDHRFVDTDPFASEGNIWSTLIPAGKGHVVVAHPAAFNLSGGYSALDPSAPEAEVYSVSAFHQLHCLATIKSVLMNASSTTADSVHSRNPLVRPNAGHVGHCVEYLRQSIMCAADTALEKATVDPTTGKPQHGVDGWGVQHVCRDFGEVVKWSEADRASDRQGLE